MTLSLPRTMPKPSQRRYVPLALLLACAFLASGCGTADDSDHAEYGYITAPTIALRDRVAAVYNKVAFLNNGDRVRILERSGNKRFVRVRADNGKEGWMPQRYLASQEVFEGFQRLAQQNTANSSQATAITRRLVNMHVTPEREGATLYQLKEGERLELLQRATTPRNAKAAAPKAAEPTPNDEDKDKAAEAEDEEAAAPAPEKAPAAKAAKGKAAQTIPAVPMEDWWLVRDSRKRVGWMLGRMIDVEVPLEVAQYAEGQRIIASHVLSEVPEHGQPTDKLVAQYLMLLSENKDGMPYDFNQVRIFTWNQKRDRYETAYRERLTGQLPFRAGKEDGNPFFVLRVMEPDGKVSERKYRMMGVMVRKVVDTPPKTAPKTAPSGAKTPAKR